MSARANSSDGESGGAEKDDLDEREDESGGMDHGDLEIMITNFPQFETTHQGRSWLVKNTVSIFEEALHSFDGRTIVLQEYSAQANVDILRACVRAAFWKLYLVGWRREEGALPKHRMLLSKSRFDSLMRFF